MARREAGGCTPRGQFVPRSRRALADQSSIRPLPRPTTATELAEHPAGAQTVGSGGQARGRTRTCSNLGSSCSARPPSWAAARYEPLLFPERPQPRGLNSAGEVALAVERAHDLDAASGTAVRSQVVADGEAPRVPAKAVAPATEPRLLGEQAASRPRSDRPNARPPPDRVP